MSGKKGMKWTTDRRPPKVQLAARIKEENLDLVKEYARLNRWTVSQAVDALIEDYLIHIYRVQEKVNNEN